jgi:hypothetical protein
VAVRSLPRKLQRFRALSASEKKAFLGAMALHPLFWIGLHTLGYARLQHWVDRASSVRPTLDNTDLDQLLALGRVVNVAARHAFGPATCLSRSLVLRWLLQRRGIETQLRIGVRLAGGELDAHAWVEHAGVPLNDSADVGERYAAFDGELSADSFHSP